jgi:hypothetical protein
MSWETLFDRADEFEVTAAEVRERLATRRDDR